MSSLIGNKPNQAPTNGDLGTMAYRDQNQFYDTTRTVGFRNRIINGAMVIDQRNAGASVTPSTGTYTLDRWRGYSSQASKFTIQQNAGSVTPPVGFTNYLGVTSSSAYTSISSDLIVFQQLIEGFNTADLGWGTANAKTVTLSFQVYSSLTGTFSGSFMNSAATRSYPFTYTISSANTWTSISVTVAGDTSGTWIGATNGIGIRLNWNLGSGSSNLGTANAWAGSELYGSTGSVSLVATSGATLYITGVQLEVGSSATGFEYRVYGTELANCQRYFFKIQADGTQYSAFSAGYCAATNSFQFEARYPVIPRVPCTGITATSAGSFLIQAPNNFTPTDITFTRANNYLVTCQATTTGLTAGYAGHLIDANNACAISFNGMEL